MSAVRRIASKVKRTPPSRGSTSTVGRTRSPRTTRLRALEQPRPGESEVVGDGLRRALRRSAPWSACASGRSTRRGRPVAAAAPRGAQRERGLPVAARARAPRRPVRSRRSADERAQLGLAVDERLVLSASVAEGEGVARYRTAALCISAYRSGGESYRTVCEIRFAYGHASAGRVLRGRRAAVVLAGRRAARGDAARGLAAGASPGEAARAPAPRPLRSARRADRGGLAALSRRTADAARRGAAARRHRRRGRRRARRAPLARRVDRACRDRRAAAALRVPASATRASGSCSRCTTPRRWSTSSPSGSSSSASSARRPGIAACASRPLAEDEVILVGPPGHPSRGRLDRAAGAPRGDADPDAGGRRRPPGRRGGAAAARRACCATSTCTSSSGCRSPSAAPCSRATASPSSRGPRSRRSSRAGALARIAVEGMDVRREIVLARGTGRVPSRAAEAFAAFARASAAGDGGPGAGLEA